MNRRKFLKDGSILFSSLTFASKVAGLTKNGDYLPENKFSVSMITDNLNQAIEQLENMIFDSAFGKQEIQFEENRLLGTHIGDIVFVKNNSLVDFRKSDDEFSKNLLSISKNHRFPKRIENPSLIRFFSIQESSNPQSVSIRSKNKLVHNLPISESIEFYNVEGKKGSIDFSLTNQKIKILSSTCKHKTCMQMGDISKPGQRIVCIPNQIIIQINGNSTGFDSITR